MTCGQCWYSRRIISLIISRWNFSQIFRTNMPNVVCVFLYAILNYIRSYLLLHSVDEILIGGSWIFSKISNGILLTPSSRCWFHIAYGYGTSTVAVCQYAIHDDAIKWKHFPRYWPYVRGIHRSPVNSPHKGQWRGALMFSLICARINGWVNNREAGDLGHYRAHYDVIVMKIQRLCCTPLILSSYRIMMLPCSHKSATALINILWIWCWTWY